MEVGGFLFGRLKFLQQFFRIAMIVGDCMWILDIEVIATGFHFIGCHFPGDIRFLPSFPLRSSHQSMQGFKCSKRMGFVIE